MLEVNYSRLFMFSFMEYGTRYVPQVLTCAIDTSYIEATYKGLFNFDNFGIQKKNLNTQTISKYYHQILKQYHYTQHKFPFG